MHWCASYDEKMNMKVNMYGKEIMRTHNVLITKASELGEFLSHQQLGHPDHREDRVPRVLRDFRSRVQLEV